MKEFEKVYETPEVEIMEVQVELGFANSYGTQNFGEQNGNW